MPQRSAFKRARHYLWNRPWAASLSIALAPLSGFLLVILLGLVGLLLDLAISRGIASDPVAILKWIEHQGSSPETLEIARSAKDHQGLGILSLAIRAHSSVLGALFQSFADALPQLRNNYVYLITLVVSIVLVALLFSGVTYLQKRTAALSAIDGITRLRRAVHIHAYRIGSMSMRQISKGPMIGSTMRAFDTLQDGLYSWFLRTFHEPCNLAWLLLFLVLIDSIHGIPYTSLILPAAAGLYLADQFLDHHDGQKGERQNALKAAEGQTLLIESLGLHRPVKSFGMEQYNKNRLERLLHRQGKAVQSRWYWQFFSRHGRWTLLAILGPLVALALIGNILSRDLRLLPVMLMLITIGCCYLILQRWQHAWLQVKKAKPAAEGLFQLLDQETDVKQVVGAEFLPSLTSKLELQNVTVLAPGSDDVLLDGLSLNIASGEHVALIGDDRARLIVAYLLPRLIDPDQGEVRFDDKPLPWVTLESVRNQTGLVLQDDLIFNDTVANNISCGQENYTLPRIIEAAKAAHAHNFIMKLKAGYDTVIGELGETLTSSQQFRIALARAILRDPAILIIEEPADGLADEDKAWLDDTLGRFLQGRTAILLAERLSTLRKADRVVMLHQGALIDQGSDAELIRRCGRYKHWQYMKFHQYQENEE